MRVLIIEDDNATAMSMELMLKSEGFNAYTTDLGEEGVDLASIYDYDLITLDLGLPDLNGLEVLRRIRAAKVNTPIMICSGTSDVAMKVKTFGGGADDYLQKPFHKDEFIARAHALVRRSKGHASAMITVGAVTLDLDGKTVDVAGARVHLTGKEYQMLELLMLRKGSTLTKEVFLNHLYGGMDEPELKIIDVFICKLRKKLTDASGVNHIETVWGRGYRMVDAPVTKAAAMESAVREFTPKNHLDTVRGRLLRVLAEHDQPLMAGTITVKLGFDGNAYETGVYASLSQATRVGLVETFGKRGTRQYGLTSDGRTWLARAGWTPAVEAAAA